MILEGPGPDQKGNNFQGKNRTQTLIHGAGGKSSLHSTGCVALAHFLALVPLLLCAVAKGMGSRVQHLRFNSLRFFAVCGLEQMT